MSKFRLAIDDFKLGQYIPISPWYGVNPIKVDKYISDGEASEIILESVLDYCPAENLVYYIGVLARKLAHGGTLSIVNTDAVLLAEAFIRGELNIIDYNKQLFGTKDHAYNFKMSTVQLCDIEDIAKRLGLKVLEKSIINTTFIIKFRRD